MKKNFTLLLSTLFILNISFAQQRYIDEVFTSSDTTNDVLYGVNFGVLSGQLIPTGYVVTDSLGNPIYQEPPLEMDIYEPSGDSLAERPLIIHMHTGTFLPIIHNGNPTGMRQDYATAEMCEGYAKRGFVVANIDYRLGWNPYLATQEERAASLMTAVYRAMQDCKAAVRYFKMSAQNMGNPYGIDTSKIVLSGQGSGGWVALAYATIDSLAEIQLPKFLLIDPMTSIAYPAVDTAVMGDWDGFGGLPNVNMENHVGYSSDVHMVVSMGGGIGDLSWLDAGDVPMCAVHCPTDPVASYYTGDVSVAQIGVVTTDISGSYDIMHKADSLGNNDVLLNATYNDVYTTAAGNAAFGRDNVFAFNTVNPYEGSPWDYWLHPVLTALAPYVGASPGQADTAHFNGLATNPDMSQTKADAYIDSTLGYFCPRIVNGLGLPGNTVGIQSNSIDANVSLYPNPAKNIVTINTEKNILSIEIYHINGSLILRKEKINNNRFILNKLNLSSGLYIVDVQLEEGVVSRKLIIE
jgi:acetyl esterase/lipase